MTKASYASLFALLSLFSPTLSSPVAAKRSSGVSQIANVSKPVSPLNYGSNRRQTDVLVPLVR